MVGEPVGFWSYTHQDNDQDDGRILRLAAKIRAEYSLLTGQDLRLFVDREDLSWGDEWRARIDDALGATTFFIPVVTPRYLLRPECRRELLAFAGHAKSLELLELLLPVVYVDVPNLKADNPDEAVSLVARIQYEDWRDLRLVDERSAEYRQGVNRLARRLAEIATKVAEAPVTAVTTPDGPVGEGLEDLTEPGTMDLLAAGEEALPKWSATIQEFPPLLERLNLLTNAAAERIQRSDAQGKGFAGRLLVARQLAADLAPVAAGILKLGQRYAAELVDIDPSMLALVRAASESASQENVNEEEINSVRELFQNLELLVRASRENADALSNLVRLLGDNASLSRDLRPVLRQIQAGLRHVLDGQAVMEEWHRRIDETGLSSGDTA